MKLRLGVIFGGVSVEHEVSIISAVQAMKHLNREKYEIIPIYIGKDKEWYTGNALKEIDIYSDIDLVKRYSKSGFFVGLDEYGRNWALTEEELKNVY